MSIFGKTRLKFARVLLLPVFFGFQNSLTSARINIFWSGKKHLVADTPLCQKQRKIRFDLCQVKDPPGPLNLLIHAELIYLIVWCVIGILESTRWFINSKMKLFYMYLLFYCQFLNGTYYVTIFYNLGVQIIEHYKKYLSQHYTKLICVCTL